MTTLTPSDYINTDVFQSITDDIEKDIYIGSVFLPLKNLSSKKKGAMFEKLYHEFKLSQGCVVTKPINSDHDRIVDGVKVEIKGSFLWGDGSHFRWQQIRTNQDYDVVVFIAVYPDRIEFYQADKQTIKDNIEVQDSEGKWIYNQHGGQRVNSGCFCIDGFPSCLLYTSPSPRD